MAWAETFMHPVMEFCVTVGMVALIYSGSKDVVAESITVGAFVAFQRYISKMVWPMTAIGWGFSLVAQGRASLRVFEGDGGLGVRDFSRVSGRRGEGAEVAFSGVHFPVAGEVRLVGSQGDTSQGSGDESSFR